jgi:hypothetical protein
MPYLQEWKKEWEKVDFDKLTGNWSGIGKPKGKKDA